MVGPNGADSGAGAAAVRATHRVTEGLTRQPLRRLGCHQPLATSEPAKLSTAAAAAVRDRKEQLQRQAQAGFSGHFRAKTAFTTSRVGVASAASRAEATGVR